MIRLNVSPEGASPANRYPQQPNMRNVKLQTFVGSWMISESRSTTTDVAIYRPVTAGDLELIWRHRHEMFKASGRTEANGIIAGISGMPWLRFLAFNMLGGALWVGCWVSVGYFGGRNITTIYDY